MTEKILSPLDLHLLESMYVSGKHTVKEIADLLECSVEFVGEHVKRKGLRVRINSSEKELPTKAITFYVTTHNRKPRIPLKLDEKTSGLLSQDISTRYYALNNKLSILKKYYAHSPNSNTNIFTKPTFREAYEFAKENNCVILIYNVFGLLARLSPADRIDYFKMLSGGEVEIIDIKFTRSLSKTDLALGIHLTILARMQTEIRSYVSNKSFRHKRMVIRKLDANIASDRAKFAAKNRRQELLPDIEAVIYDLKARGKVSLQLIADELNRREIRSPRGHQWTKGTITNILKKLEIDHRK